MFFDEVGSVGLSAGLLRLVGLPVWLRISKKSGAGVCFVFVTVMRIYIFTKC